MSKWKWKCLSFLMFFLPEFDCSILKMNCRKMVGKWSLFSEFVYLLTGISLWRICKICHKYTERKSVLNRIFLWVYICWKMYKISIWEMLGKWGHLQLYNCMSIHNFPPTLSIVAKNFCNNFTLRNVSGMYAFYHISPFISRR